MSDRKERLREYKETPLQMGVYCIRNTVNGKCFVGSARNVPGKLNGHRFQLRMNVHRNDVLQREWKQYGAEAFVFEALDLLDPADAVDYDPAEDLRVLEELWLQKLEPFGERGYNRKGRSY